MCGVEGEGKLLACSRLVLICALQVLDASDADADEEGVPTQRGTSSGDGKSAKVCARVRVGILHMRVEKYAYINCR